MNTLFTNELIKRCVISDEEAHLFRADLESSKRVFTDEETGARIVAYVHTDGRVLIDHIETSSS